MVDLDGILGIRVSVVAVLIGQAIVLGGLAFLGYRIYRNESEVEVLRVVGLIAMFICLVVIVIRLEPLMFWIVGR